MLSGALDATVKLGKAIEHGITQPGRELAGLVSGAKATVDSLLDQSSGLSQDLVGKISSFFAKKVGPKVTEKPRPVPAYRTNPAQPNVKPFASMATSTIVKDDSPGVSSGSGGNGDPIVG